MHSTFMAQLATRHGQYYVPTTETKREEEEAEEEESHDRQAQIFLNQISEVCHISFFFYVFIDSHSVWPLLCLGVSCFST